MLLKYAITVSIRYPFEALKRGGTKMIKRDVLTPSGKPSVRYSAENAQILSVEVAKKLLEDVNEEKYGLPITVMIDQVKSGGLFNSSVEDCVIIRNNEHSSDYFSYCLTIQKQGKMAYLSVYYYGMSTLTAKRRQSEERKGSLGGMLMNAISGVDQAAYDAEYQYYDMLDALIDETLG